MGRELRRKEEKKNKNRNIKKVEELDTSIKKSTIVKLVLSVALLLVVVYYISAIFITKEIRVKGFNDDEETTETTATSTTDKILAKNIFNQQESSYYVYFYDFNDADEAIDSAISGKSDWKVYRVDTGSGLNHNYVTEESGNRNVTSINDLKVKNPTIIQVTADKVTAYYEGSSEILSMLG